MSQFSPTLLSLSPIRTAGICTTRFFQRHNHMLLLNLKYLKFIHLELFSSLFSSIVRKSNVFPESICLEALAKFPRPPPRPVILFPNPLSQILFILAVSFNIFCSQFFNFLKPLSNTTSLKTIHCIHADAFDPHRCLHFPESHSNNPKT